MNTAQAFWAKVDKSGPCWIWKGGLSKGYGILRWKGKVRTAHTVAWELTFGIVPEGIEVCHSCDIQSCVNAPGHLFLGTHQANMQDAYNKGRLSPLDNRIYKSGEKSPHAKLTWERVRAIRLRYIQGGISYEQLAELENVSRFTIRKLIQGRSWKE